jgi:uncharacterized membrane protein YeaQ/YmgE (transglycosylase-associated protein family)
VLNFVWWFLVGPIAGWLVGKVMKTSHIGWLNAAAGLVGAVLAGVLTELLGFDPSRTGLGAALTGAAGAITVTFIFAKVIAPKSTPAQSSSSKSRSYTSYKSRMGK